MKSAATAVLIIVFVTKCGGYDEVPKITRRIELKQGALYGIIEKPRLSGLPEVERYLGVPYAEPPLGKLRFMPPGRAPMWLSDKYATSFPPVCLQKFPDTRNMEPRRKGYVKRLMSYLTNQSEDCLYLNVYAPRQNGSVTELYPVMVYIHGESYEWNSGNPYDGSILAGTRKVVVVTINYRLGILGFLQASTGETPTGNFGLVDQIAALLWVQENIEQFGGDPDRVTIFGQGTGAACANLLMLSPMVQLGNKDKLLFRRVILMGGSALSDWAMAGSPLQVTHQVSQALNCPLTDDFLDCLRNKNITDIMNISVQTPPYTTPFGPIVDGRVVPNEPRKAMTAYTDLFSRFEVMFGADEAEGMQWMDVIELTQGLLERELQHELDNYFKMKCEGHTLTCKIRAYAEYTNPSFRGPYEDDRDIFSKELDSVIVNRNVLLAILSDGRTLAPLLQTALYHTALKSKPKSYCYIFGYRTKSHHHVIDKTASGDELPYIFGVPLDSPKFHYTDIYTPEERRLSEKIMTYWANFAYKGDPEGGNFTPMTMKEKFYFSGPRYKREWHEFNNGSQNCLYIDDVPVEIYRYRETKMVFWNDEFYNLTQGIRPPELKRTTPSPPEMEPFPFPFARPTPPVVYGIPIYTPPPSSDETGNAEDPVDGLVMTPPDPPHKGYMNVFIIIGGIFLVVNMLLFIGLYYKCTRVKKRSENKDRNEIPSDAEDASEKCAKLNQNGFIVDGCNFIKSLSKTSRGDLYEPVRISGSASSSKQKLTRQMSNSTIDPHMKVREWIAQEIVQKCSPRILRRPRDTTDESPTKNGKFFKRKRSLKPPLQRSDSKTVAESPSLGRSPTRPVTPIETLIVQKPQQKKKAEKVSVAVDATPAGRGSSVLRQQPIELTKSLDCPPCQKDVEVPLRRSLTLDNVSVTPKVQKPDNLRKSSANINMNCREIEAPVIFKIQHGYSKSDPVEDLYAYTRPKKLKTFEPNADVNVTSRDENADAQPLTPEESLLTIKRRNFPKVLPDYPAKEALARKRRSMPAGHHGFSPIPEGSSISSRIPPAPPVRTSSTLGRNVSPSVMCQSAPVVAKEPPVPEEMEVICNNLYVGPLIPSRKPEPIYDSLVKLQDKMRPKVVVTADPDHPIRKVEPKIIIRPGMNYRSEQKNKYIPRVTASDNQPNRQEEKLSDVKEEEADKETKVVNKLKPRPSQIPTLVKNSSSSSKDSSGSDSTSPSSEDSDTGTVVKRV